MIPNGHPVFRQLPFAMGLACVFSFLWAAIEHLGAGIRVSPYQVVWTRYATQLALLLLLFGPRQRAAMLRTRHLSLQAGASLLMLGMPMCFILAMRRMPLPGITGVFWFTAPLMLTAASVLFGRDSTGAIEWASIISGSVGAVLAGGLHAGPVRLAWLLPLGMAACFAGYQLALRALAAEPVLPKLFHTALWVFITLTLAGPIFWRRPATADLISMIVIGALGCIALFALDRALEIASPVLLAPAVCTQPVWAAFLETRMPGRLSILGTILIVSSISAILLRHHPLRDPHAAAHRVDA
jgi:drug/metabolite transporter (DMT)-like permease